MIEVKHWMAGEDVNSERTTFEDEAAATETLSCHNTGNPEFI